LNNNFHNIDACEIWETYVEKYKLREKYKNVMVSDICDLEFEFYDVIIMGDVLEHIDIDRTKILLERLKSKCIELIILVPYQNENRSDERIELDKKHMAEQWYGNIYEAHIQTDINPSIMVNRYPSLKLLFNNIISGHKCGVYSQKNK